MAKGTSRTAVFYQTHPRSAQKHSDDNNSGKGGKYAHSKKYKRDHMRARRRLKIAKGMDSRGVNKNFSSSLKKLIKKNNFHYGSF